MNTEHKSLNKVAKSEIRLSKLKDQQALADAPLWKREQLALNPQKLRLHCLSAH